jgi:hypothetical protein
MFFDESGTTSDSWRPDSNFRHAFCRKAFSWSRHGNPSRMASWTLQTLTGGPWADISLPCNNVLRSPKTEDQEILGDLPEHRLRCPRKVHCLFLCSTFGSSLHGGLAPDRRSYLCALETLRGPRAFRLTSFSQLGQRLQYKCLIFCLIQLSCPGYFNWQLFPKKQEHPRTSVSPMFLALGS